MKRQPDLSVGLCATQSFFYKQFAYSSEPGVANEILENELKSFLAVA